MGTVTVAGVTYGYRSRLVDTDFGPENEVVFSHDGQVVTRHSECMTTEMIVQMFVDHLTEFAGV
jgi:hypothetical protein